MSLDLPDLKTLLETFHHGRWANRPVELPDAFPRALRDFYHTFGGLIDQPEGQPGPFAFQDRLLPSRDLRAEDGFLVFATEHQECWRYRVPLGNDDPVVETDVDDAVADRFLPLFHRLAEFLVTFALQEAVLSAAWLVDLEDDPRLPDALGLAPVALQATDIFNHPLEFFVSGDQKTLMMRHHRGIFIGSNVHALQKTIPETFSPGLVHSPTQDR